METNDKIKNSSSVSFTLDVKNGKAVSTRPRSDVKKSSVSDLVAMLDKKDTDAVAKAETKQNPDKTVKDTANASSKVSTEKSKQFIPISNEKTEFQKMTSFDAGKRTSARRPTVGRKVIIGEEKAPAPKPVQEKVSSADNNAVEMPKDPSLLTREERMALRRERALLKNRRVIFKNTALLFLIVIILVNVINLLTPDKDKSLNESRALQGFPSFSVSSLLDGSFGSQLEDYVTDQFFMRDNWITLKLNGDKALGKKETNGVILGKDGYLMEDPDEVDYSNVDKNIAALNSFAQSHTGLKINMAIIPNNVTTMKDYLPKNIPVRDQTQDLAYLMNNLDAGINFIDTTATLKAHEDDYIYYRTDHHWTSLGAYYAFMDMASDLGISDPISSYNVYTVTDSFEGTMSSKSGSHIKKYRDSIEVYTPAGVDSQFYVLYNDTYEKSASLYQSDKLNDKDKYTVFLGGNHPQVTINTTVNNGKVLLLIKDSYANSFVQFLTPYYEEIVMIDPRYYYESVSSIIDSESVTDVLFLYNCNTYMGDTSLANVLG